MLPPCQRTFTSSKMGAGPGSRELILTNGWQSSGTTLKTFGFRNVPFTTYRKETRRRYRTFPRCSRSREEDEEDAA